MANPLPRSSVSPPHLTRTSAPPPIPQSGPSQVSSPPPQTPPSRPIALRLAGSAPSSRSHSILRMRNSAPCRPESVTASPRRSRKPSVGSRRGGWSEKLSKISPGGGGG